MKNKRCLILLIAIACSCTSAAPQVKTYSVANGHSHNDYLGSSPFYQAFEKGFGSIEADVFPVNGQLLVAHTRKEISTEKTLKDLYIEPLRKAFDAGSSRELKLLIDIKEDHETSLSLLLKELEPLRKYLSTREKSNLATIVISGDRPAPAKYDAYPGFIFFDADLKRKHNAAEWERVALVSLPFNKITNWNGENEPGEKDRHALKNIIDSVHSAGKPIRFWAAPDTHASWKWQMTLKADLIGTDKINDLALFLENEANDTGRRD